MTGHEECIQMLLEQEVLILCKDARGRTPLHYAAARGHATWLSELMQLALSEDYNFKDNQNYTPLHWASYNGNLLCQADIYYWLLSLVWKLHAKRDYRASKAIIVSCCKLLEIWHHSQINAMSL